MAPPNLRIKKACEAMKPLKLPENKVKLVLRKLLKTYENNWELIEDDGNYTALAEALLDEDTEKEKEVKNQSNSKSKVVGTNSRGKRKASEQTQALVLYKEDDESEEDDVPLKRLRRKPARLIDYNGTNSSGSSMSKKAKEEDPKLAQREEKEEDDRDNMPERPLVKRYVRRSVEKKYDNTSCNFNNPMPMKLEMDSNAGALIVLDNHQPLISDIAPVLEMEKANMLKNSDTAHKPTIPENSSTELELACSTSSEVKITLSFTPAGGEETTNLRLPSMEELGKAMEKRCLDSYKIIHPGFSVHGFMKDMCSCYIELAKNPNKQSLEEAKTVSDTNKACEESSSMGLVVVPECDISADGWRVMSNIHDITLGEEDVMIPWKNDINEEIPSHFSYISHSVVCQEASVKFFSLSSFSDEQCCFSSCIGDCLVSSSSPCKCTTAYTIDGLLKDDFLEERISEALDLRKQELMFCKECPVEKAKKEEVLEPCKGHIKRKAIKECWIKCDCTKRCGNKTVQRGIHNKLEVFYTPNGKGWGLRTLEKLRKGAFVCEYIGEILTVSELYQRSFEDKLASSSPVILDAFWGCSDESLQENKALCLDGTRYGNISRFINHRCLDANLIEIPVHIETPDQQYYHLAFFTTRDIDAVEELTWDYGIEFDDDDSLMNPFSCFCGSRFCRNSKRSKKGKKVMNIA